MRKECYGERDEGKGIKADVLGDWDAGRAEVGKVTLVGFIVL